MRFADSDIDTWQHCIATWHWECYVSL